MPKTRAALATANVAVNVPNPDNTMVGDRSLGSGTSKVSLTTLRDRDKIWGYNKENPLSDEEILFNEILEDEIGLNRVTSEEVF